MSALEICLIIVGIVCIIVSFVFVSSGEADTPGNASQAELSATQLEKLNEQVDEIIKEQMSVLEEKTEITVEKISNRKIMELSEYSDTVLAQINRNHEESMFLYDMLNEKTKVVKRTINEFEAAKAELAKAESSLRQSETVSETNTGLTLPDEKPKKTTRTRKTTAKKQGNEAVFDELASSVEDIKDDIDGAKVLTASKAKTSGKKSTAVSESTEETREKKTAKTTRTTRTRSKAVTVSNNNDRILKLHSEGKSNLEIAKILGLGIGEVKLVVDLFKGDEL